MTEKEYDITTQVLDFQSDTHYETCYHKPNLVEIEQAIYLSKASDNLPDTVIRETVIEHYDERNIKEMQCYQSESRSDRMDKLSTIFGILLAGMGLATAFSLPFSIYLFQSALYGSVAISLIPVTSFILSGLVYSKMTDKVRAKKYQCRTDLENFKKFSLKEKLEAKVREFTRKQKKQDEIAIQQANQPLEEKIAHQL